jgi:Kef-type K+ transport system membrane component KefB
MVNIIVLIGILAFGYAIKSVLPYEHLENAAPYALGLVIICGYIFGKLAKRIKLPSITGYILAGVLVGPYGLELITPKNVEDLQLLNGLALSLIALNAGGEIKYSGLKKNLKSILSILFFQTLFIIAGFILMVIAMRGVFPFFSDSTVFHNLEMVIAAGLLMGIIATASAPSTTLAVIVDSKVKNRYTELILSIVMLKDVILLFLFVIGLSVSRTLVGGGAFEASTLLTIFLELSGSIVSGIIIGAIIVFYLKVQKKNHIIFLLAISFFSYEIFEQLHLHPLLIMMIAGFVVQNFSTKGKKLIKALESISPPVYTVFFCLIGTALKLSYLQSFLILALLIALCRKLFKFTGTYIGSAVSGEDSMIKNNGWMAFVSQAGVSLGMATIIQKTLGTFGNTLFPLIVSVIVLNEIIGPLLLKFFVDKTDKAQQTLPDTSSIAGDYIFKNKYRPPRPIPLAEVEIPQDH